MIDEILVCGPGDKEWRGRLVAIDEFLAFLDDAVEVQFVGHKINAPLDDPKPDFVIGGDS